MAVEFVHPVIVGKRALPALGLTAEGGPLVDQVALMAEPGDIGSLRRRADAPTLARERGLPDVAFGRGGAEWSSSSRRATTRSCARSWPRPLYHVLWELVHVFFEHRGLLRAARAVHDSGAASFLYPFLGATASPTSTPCSTTCGGPC